MPVPEERRDARDRSWVQGTGIRPGVGGHPEAAAAEQGRSAVASQVIVSAPSRGAQQGPQDPSGSRAARRRSRECPPSRGASRGRRPGPGETPCPFPAERHLGSFGPSVRGDAAVPARGHLPRCRVEPLRVHAADETVMTRDRPAAAARAGAGWSAGTGRSPGRRR